MKRQWNIILSIISLHVALFTLGETAWSATSAVNVTIGLDEDHQIVCEEEPCTFHLDPIQITVTQPPKRQLSFREMITDPNGKIIPKFIRLSHSQVEKLTMRSWSFPQTAKKIRFSRPSWKLTLPEGHYQYRLYLNQQLVSSTDFEIQVIANDEDSTEQKIDESKESVRQMLRQGYVTIGSEMQSFTRDQALENHYEDGLDLLSVTIQKLNRSNPTQLSGTLIYQNRSEKETIGMIRSLDINFNDTEEGGGNQWIHIDPFMLNLPPGASKSIPFETIVSDLTVFNPNTALAMMTADYSLASTIDASKPRSTPLPLIEKTEPYSGIIRMLPPVDTFANSGRLGNEISYITNQKNTPSNQFENVDDVIGNAYENGKNILVAKVNAIHAENWHTIVAHVTLSNRSTRNVTITQLVNLQVQAITNESYWNKRDARKSISSSLITSEKLPAIVLKPGESQSVLIRIYTAYALELVNEDLGWSIGLTQYKFSGPKTVPTQSKGSE